MASQLVHCPHCDGELMVIPRSVVVAVRAIDNHGRSKSAVWLPGASQGRSLGSFARSLFPNAGPFESEAAALMPQAKPFGQSGRPLAGTADPLSQVDLSPGTTQFAKTYRERSTSDVAIPLLANVVSSGMVGLITLSGSLTILSMRLVTRPMWLSRAQWWIGHRWYVLAPAAFLATMAGLWFARQLPDLLDDDKLITNYQHQVRKPPPAPVVVESPAINLEINERRERGGGRQDRVTLRSPVANVQGLPGYCAALAQNEAFPSWEGGKSKPGAQGYGYTEAEFDTWRRACVKAKLLIERPGRNQGCEITPRGQHAFERIGEQQLEEASYGL